MSYTVRAVDWRKSGACRETDPEVFYPNPGDTRGTEYAKAICANRPVRRACLEAALAEEGGRAKDNRFGVRGGKTHSQRYALYSRRRTSRTTAEPTQQPAPKHASEPKKREPAKCGTRAGYQRHRRNGEEACDACSRANTDADNRLRRTGTTKALAA